MDNLLGTRTKVGIGPFLTPQQNEPIPSSPYFEFGHAALVRTSGSFQLSVNTNTMTAILSDYSSNRVPQNNLTLTGTVALNNQAFRTASPDAIYPANLPPIKLGSVHVDTFKVTQKATANTGTMVRLTNGTYRVSINFMANVQVRISELGQVSPMLFTMPYSLVGNLKINGVSAAFGYDLGQGGENVVRDVNTGLLGFPISFTDANGPGGTYRMNTTIKTVGISIAGMRQMVAVSL